MDFLHKHSIVLTNLRSEGHYYTAISKPNQYFAVPQFMQRQKEYLVEVAAFLGDSLKRFIWTNPELKKVYAFEPAKRQFNALEARIKRLNTEWALEDDRITALNVGIGEHPQQIRIYEPTGFSSFNIHETDGGGFESLDLIPIDDYFKDRFVSFLKADREGAEMLILEGAPDAIREQMSKIAVCTYHYISILTDIVSYIMQLMPAKYNFALRHRAYDFTETVQHY